MSMNLHCNKIDLWQTPTYITHMCLETSSPKSALKAYCHWVRDQNISVMKTQEDIDYANSQRELINYHIAEVEAVMDEEGLEVYYL